MVKLNFKLIFVEKNTQIVQFFSMKISDKPLMILIRLVVYRLDFSLELGVCFSRNVSPNLTKIM